MVVVNNAWVLEKYPGKIIIEPEDATGLLWFDLEPMRRISEDDLAPYLGPNPRKVKGAAGVPEWLYPYYGIERSPESLSAMIHIRVKESERIAFSDYARARGDSVSDILREYIRTLIG